MTRTEIIDLANSLTERKGEGVFNMNTLYAHVLQEFCGENRFWWRQVAFSTAPSPLPANTGSYVIFGSGVRPITDCALEEISNLWIQDASGNLTELDVITDRPQGVYLDNQSGAKSVSAPSAYYLSLSANAFQVGFDKAFDQAYNVIILGWMMPDPASDSVSDAVPLIPSRFHRGIVHGMEKYIWRTVYGPEDTKYITAAQQYQKVVDLAQIRSRFTTNYTTQLISAEDAIRSTR